MPILPGMGTVSPEQSRPVLKSTTTTKATELARLKGLAVWKLFEDAIDEYAENHKDELKTNKTIKCNQKSRK